MEFGIGTILAGLWTAVGVPLVVRGFQWLSSTISKNKAMESWQFDGEIRNALETAISNIGNKTADAMRKNPKEWKEVGKVAAREEAKDQALLLLNGKARTRFHELGDAGINILIRKLVDDRAKK